MKDLTKEMLNLDIKTHVFEDLQNDNFCLDMGTTPLATERGRPDNLMNQEIQFEKEDLSSEDLIDSSEEINKQMFKKISKPKKILFGTDLFSDDQEMILNKKNMNEENTKECEFVDYQIIELQRSIDEIIPLENCGVPKRNHKKRRLNRNKKRYRRKKKKIWSKPKKLIQWKSTESGTSQQEYEIEQVFNNNRSDFEKYDPSFKDKVSNCMCKAF